MIRYTKEPLPQDMFNALRENVCMSYSDSINMLNPLMALAFGRVTVDITKFSTWMEEKYPEYLDDSLANFLHRKDPEHEELWRWLFGIVPWSDICDLQAESAGFCKE